METAVTIMLNIYDSKMLRIIKKTKVKNIKGHRISKCT